MAVKSQIAIRSKTLGLLIRDARTHARRSVTECAQAVGIKAGLFRAYEEGRRAPSLPELEALVYFLDLPIDHFWSKEIKSDKPRPYENLDLQKLHGVRQRKIGALLRQERMNASISIRHLAHETGISAAFNSSCALLYAWAACSNKRAAARCSPFAYSCLACSTSAFTSIDKP